MYSVIYEYKRAFDVFGVLWWVRRTLREVKQWRQSLAFDRAPTAVNQLDAASINITNTITASPFPPLAAVSAHFNPFPDTSNNIPDSKICCLIARHGMLAPM